jgi:hypothetical protein
MGVGLLVGVAHKLNDTKTLQTDSEHIEFPFCFEQVACSYKVQQEFTSGALKPQ